MPKSNSEKMWHDTKLEWLDSGLGKLLHFVFQTHILRACDAICFFQGYQRLVLRDILCTNIFENSCIRDLLKRSHNWLHEEASSYVLMEPPSFQTLLNTYSTAMIFNLFCLMAHLQDTKIFKEHYQVDFCLFDCFKIDKVW